MIIWCITSNERRMHRIAYSPVIIIDNRYNKSGSCWEIDEWFTKCQFDNRLTRHIPCGKWVIVDSCSILIGRISLSFWKGNSDKSTQQWMGDCHMSDIVFVFLLTNFVTLFPNEGGYPLWHEASVVRPLMATPRCINVHRGHLEMIITYINQMSTRMTFTSLSVALS